MIDLTNKNILFISPEFFGIDKSIIDYLKSNGANVTYIDERSVKTAFGRALNSKIPGIFYFHSNIYYKKELSRCPDYFDTILVIKGEMISKKTLNAMRNSYPNAKIILYLYDSIVNVKGILNKTHLYDEVLSFDRLDCIKYGFRFRPLFSDIESQIRECATSYTYDICFYGTMHGDRFDIVHKYKTLCEKQNLKFYSFCYLRGKFMTIYYLLTNRGFRKLKVKAIDFKPKSAQEIAEIVASSMSVLDINSITQSGLTIRTLETIVSGKKLITTNADIREYDIYNENNILVIDRDRTENIEVLKCFLDKPSFFLDNKIIHKYTVEGWVEDVFV